MHDEPGIRGFRSTFIAVGVLTSLMASAGLASGLGMLREFGVPEATLASPVLADFFSFFYESMAFIGLFTVLFGLTTRGWRAQRLVASVFTGTSLLLVARELSTSDTRFGNHLYHGDATLIFVLVDLAFAAAFGALAIMGWWRLAAIGARSSGAGGSSQELSDKRAG